MIAKPTETPSAVVRPEPTAMEQNPMIPPVDDEITIVHVVTPDAPVNVEDAIEVVVADPTEIIASLVSAVEETIIIEPTESRRDSMKATCVIERYKEAIGVIEKHSRVPTVI